MRRVRLVEVGPRDGLQTERTALSVVAELAFIGRLGQAGHARVEAGAFVHPQRVPQMAETAEVFKRLPKHEGVTYSALVPNARGMAAALDAGAREVAVFTAASETFNRKNVNMGIEKSFEAIGEVVGMAPGAGVPVRGYLSTCFGCPYEGPVDEGVVAALCARLLEVGCFEVSVSDTIGVATPGDVARVLGAVLSTCPVERVALHLHDTRGTALACIVRALDLGVGVFDAAAGGAGGCPFAPGAAGNVASEDVVYLLHGMGLDTGVDLARAVAASRALEAALGRRLSSRVLHAPPWPDPDHTAKRG